jgi:hypothetical protein
LHSSSASRNRDARVFLTTTMDIRFVSSLTPDDESQLAVAILAAARGLLNQFDLPCTIHIETTDGRIFQHSGVPEEALARVSDVAAT